MGGSKQYLESGGFKNQTFKQVGEANGIKEVKSTKGNDGSPMYSNTPYAVYSAKIKDSDVVNQVSVYGGKDGRQKIKDIDIGHKHTNDDGKVFSPDTIHVQEYDGMNRLSGNARKPSKKERRLLMLARNKR